MATASQQHQQQHPPPSQTPSHEQPHPTTDPDPWDGDNGDRMFNIYIWDYCNKRGYKKTCHDLQEEAKLGTEFHPPIDAKQGLLYEWWSVFWVLFGAKNTGTGPEEALVYVQHQMLRNQNNYPPLGRFQNPAMNGIVPPNHQAGPPPAPANGPPAGIGRGMPIAPGAGPVGPPQAPMQPLPGMQTPHMLNGIVHNHGGPSPQPSMGQPQQPGQGANGAPQQPPQQNTPGQPSPHNSQQQQHQQQSSQPQHPPQPPPPIQQQHGQTPLGFPGPMPGPGSQPGPAPGQPNGIIGGPHHMQGPAGMNMPQRGSIPNMGFGGVGRGGGPQPQGLHQSPTMAHAHPNAPQPPPGQQIPGGSQMPPPYPGIPPSVMGGMRPGPMYPPQQQQQQQQQMNGAGPTTPGAMNAGTPGPGPAPAGANQPFGMPGGGPGGSRAATPASTAGAGGVGGAALTQRSPSMANASVGRGAGTGPSASGGSGAGRGRGAKRGSVSPGDEPVADPQGNKVEGSPPDRKKPRHSPNSDNAAPQAGPSGTNVNVVGTAQQPPQVPASGIPPGIRPGMYQMGQMGQMGMPSGMIPGHITQQLVNTHMTYKGHPGAMQKMSGMPGSPSATAGGTPGPQQQNKPGASMMPPPSPATANSMKPGSTTGPQPPNKPEGAIVPKAEGSPRGGPQAGAPSSSGSAPGIGHSPATPAPGAPSPGHTAPASRPGTASSNHIMTPNALTPTATQQQQPPPPPPPSAVPQSSTPVMSAGGNGANGGNSAGALGSFDMSFDANMGISGMDDFTAMFRDDFERDFGAWFSTGTGADDVLDPMR